MVLSVLLHTCFILLASFCADNICIYLFPPLHVEQGACGSWEEMSPKGVWLWYFDLNTWLDDPQRCQSALCQIIMVSWRSYPPFQKVTVLCLLTYYEVQRWGVSVTPLCLYVSSEWAEVVRTFVSNDMEAIAVAGWGRKSAQELGLESPIIWLHNGCKWNYSFTTNTWFAVYKLFFRNQNFFVCMCVGLQKKNSKGETIKNYLDNHTKLYGLSLRQVYYKSLNIQNCLSTIKWIFSANS